MVREVPTNQSDGPTPYLFAEGRSAELHCACYHSGRHRSGFFSDVPQPLAAAWLTRVSFPDAFYDTVLPSRRQAALNWALDQAPGTHPGYE